MAEELTKEQKYKNLGYVIKLVAAAVNGDEPPEPDKDISFESVFSMCKKHDIANTAFYAVEKLKNKPDQPLYKKWRDERNMCVHRHMIQVMEDAELTKAFNDNGIDFMRIKGFPVCNLYPEPDYRFMGDLDFLLRYEDLKRAREIVESMGYIPDIVGKVHHDEYKKPPLMVIELHHSMVSASSGETFYNYYKDYLNRCEKGEGHEYRMSREDFYIFEVVHLKKHYDEAGTGIRSFLDMYLLNKKTLPELDRSYVDAELEKLGLAEFNEFVGQIANKWFERRDVDSFSDEELYIISSGVYGIDIHRYMNRKKGLSDRQFLIQRIFPSVNWMKETYPILRKSMIFLPFTYVHRAVVKSFRNRKDIAKELKVTKAAKKN